MKNKNTSEEDLKFGKAEKFIYGNEKFYRFTRRHKILVPTIIFVIVFLGFTGEFIEKLGASFGAVIGVYALDWCLIQLFLKKK